MSISFSARFQVSVKLRLYLASRCEESGMCSSCFLNDDLVLDTGGFALNIRSQK